MHPPSLQLMVETFPLADVTTQRSLLRLLGGALSQHRSHRMWLALGSHTGAQQAIRRAAAPHVAAWRLTRCQRLWTLLARAHFRLLWRDPGFFEDSLTVEFVKVRRLTALALSQAATHTSRHTPKTRDRPPLGLLTGSGLLRHIAPQSAVLHRLGPVPVRACLLNCVRSTGCRLSIARLLHCRNDRAGPHTLHPERATGQQAGAEGMHAEAAAVLFALPWQVPTT